MVKCENEDCKYYDCGECAIIIDNIDDLEIDESGSCISFEFMEENK